MQGILVLNTFFKNEISKSYRLTTVILVMLVSCKSEGQKIPDIEQKNNCFNDKLEVLKSQKIYTEVMSAFIDTFQILKTNIKIFGSENVVSNKIDESIFFKKDSSECLLIVLQRMADTAYVFGSARIVHGIKEAVEWRFEVGLEYNFGKEYFDLYDKNSFENISLLARYSVLANGNVKQKGCEIDDHYWFVYLKQ